MEEYELGSKRQPDEELGYYYGGYMTGMVKTIGVHRVVRTSPTKYGHFSKPAYKAFPVLRYRHNDMTNWGQPMTPIPIQYGNRFGENLSLGDKSDKAREGRLFFRISGTPAKIANIDAPQQLGVIAITESQRQQIKNDIKNLNEQ
jgi:hypothetical protein